MNQAIVKDKITFGSIDPIEIYGPKNEKINLIKSYFPDLKITARGTEINLKGDVLLINQFKTSFLKIINYFHKYAALTNNDIERLIHNGVEEEENFFDFSLIGKNRLIIKPKTMNQRKMISLSALNNLLFALGPAGTGKTYMAIALAVKAFREQKVKKIILTRPAVEAGENLGFLPGDLYDKLSPYMRPLYDALNDMFSKEKLNYSLQNNQIEIVPLAFMRGRTLDKAFVILDEAQNTTIQQMKMFLTRMGPAAKFVICGDISQIDLPKNQDSGLIHASNLLKNIKGIDFVKFDEKDVIRHELVKSIIKAYNK